jgi:hypothetical protein
MIRNNVTVDETIQLLNELLELDKNGVLALVESRVVCNEKLADHPTVQVRETADQITVGILGVINGLFGVDEKGLGAIMLVMNDTTKEANFIRTADYQQTTPLATKNT